MPHVRALAGVTSFVVAAGMTVWAAAWTAADVDAIAGKTVISGRVPGLSIAVVQEGRTLYANGIGSVSLTERRPPTVDTQYRLASVSKPLTAVAVFRLVADGKVKLDEPAKTYCRELAALNGSPTVRHFLMHRSGMRHSTDAEDSTITGAAPTLGASLMHVVHEPLRFVPGASTLYTSWGYVALGCVIESASRMPYQAFMRERVFVPAGMTATAFDSPAYSSPTFAPGFRSGILTGLRPSLVVDTRFKTPASGVISTVADLTRFAAALLDGRLLPNDLVQEMFKVERDPHGNVGFTAGWTPKGRSPAGDVYDYNGSMEGSTAFLEVVPDRRYALALLANRERYTAELQPTITTVRELILESKRF